MQGETPPRSTYLRVSWSDCASTRFAVGETEQDARERLRSFIPNLQAWHKSFVDSGGGDGDGNAPGNAAAAPPLQRSVSFGKQQNVPIAIPKILEIEESISSPVYGIKGAPIRCALPCAPYARLAGKIDVSVEVASIDGRMRFVAPLELKGGKKHGSDGSVYHKAQVYLYMLLMTERYRTSLLSSQTACALACVGSVTY